jgi:molecular chaperone HscB
MNPLTRNHFALFGLPERYRTDPTALEAAFRSVQSTVHPDRFAGGSDAERRVAMQIATQANEAYRTLRDPARRAAYLCELHGVALQSESNTAMPPAFLMQQMEWREQLDEARGRRDHGALETLREALGGERDALLQRLAAAIDEASDYHAAAQCVRQLMFLDRFAADIDAAEDVLLHS